MPVAVISCGSSADSEAVTTDDAAVSSASGLAVSTEPQATLFGYPYGGLSSNTTAEFMFASFEPEQIVRNSSAIVIADVMNIEPQLPPTGQTCTTLGPSCGDATATFDFVVSEVLAGDPALAGNTYSLNVSLILDAGVIYQIEASPIPELGQHLMFLAPAGFTGELPPSGGKIISVGNGYGRIPIDQARQDGTLDLVMSLSDELGAQITPAEPPDG